MQCAKHNPKENQLGGGLTDDALRDALRRSGYPLQTLVADRLRKKFGVVQEWSYIDPDSNQLRALDLMASLALDGDPEEHPRVRPSLSLLVECKQSDLPYVFFLSPTPLHAGFPLFAGLRAHEIEIRTDDSWSTWIVDLLSLLDLSNHPFIHDAPAYCAAFSKCGRKGADLELSGADAYNGLILPLVKAMHYFKKRGSPVSTARYFDLHVLIGVAVVRAPMVGVRVTEDSEEMELMPWIRVVRHESYDVEGWWKRQGTVAIDIVHSDFLQSYLDQHLVPFSTVCANLALKHHEVLARGRGFVPGMLKYGFEKIEARLRKP